jgi:hypothetical protein
MAILKLSLAYLRANDFVSIATPYLVGVIDEGLPLAIVFRVVYGLQYVSASVPEPSYRYVLVPS